MRFIQNIKLFSFSNKFKLFIYSLSTTLINQLPKGLKNTYEFMREFKSSDIEFTKSKDGILCHFLLYGHRFSVILNENSSDSDVFRQIFLEEEYKDVLKLLKERNINIQTCIDAGANVGFTTIYIKSFFPDAEIIAVEPNITTFQRLDKNVKLNNLQNCKLYNIGLWSRTTQLNADTNFRDKQDWSFRLTEDGNNSITFPVISPEELISNSNWDYVDFLKIDIEGGEDEIFQKDNDFKWLSKIKSLTIEIHDEFYCRDRIESILILNGFELFHSGELTVGINNHFNNI